MNWAKLYEFFDELPKSEQLQLFQAMQTALFPESKEDIASMVGDIREVRFSSGHACVHCGSISVKRNGKYRSRQRYLCRDCGKTFNDMTASPLSGTHYPHKWLKYFKLMLEGVSLPKTKPISLRAIKGKGISPIVSRENAAAQLVNGASARNKSALLLRMTEAATSSPKWLGEDGSPPMKSTLF